MSYVSGQGVTLFRAREPTGSGWGGGNEGWEEVPTGASDALRIHSFGLRMLIALSTCPGPFLSNISNKQVNSYKSSRPNCWNLFPNIKSQVHSNSEFGKPHTNGRGSGGQQGLGKANAPVDLTCGLAQALLPQRGVCRLPWPPGSPFQLCGQPG